MIGGEEELLRPTARRPTTLREKDDRLLGGERCDRSEILSIRASFQYECDVLCARCEYGVSERLSVRERSALGEFGRWLSDEGRDGRNDALSFREHSFRLGVIIARHERESSSKHVGGEKFHATSNDGRIGDGLTRRVRGRDDVDGEQSRRGVQSIDVRIGSRILICEIDLS